MQVCLFDDKTVEIDPGSRAIAYGSWFGVIEPTAPLPYPHALLKIAHCRLSGRLADRKVKRAVLIDIGACTGNYALLPAHLPGLHVFAYEPNPVVFPFLESNVALNGIDDRVQLFNYALGDFNGTGELCVPVDHGEHGLATLGVPSRYNMWGVAWKKVPVEVRRLDDIYDGPIDFIKIDVEGAEKMVLLGGEHIIRKNRPDMIVEIINCNTRQFGYECREVVDLLESWGARGIQVSHEDWLFTWT